MVRRIGRIVRVAEDALLVLLLVGMILLAAAQILLRNVAHTGIGWSDPALRLAVLWVALLGAMSATRARKHISIDILSHLVSSRVRTPIRRLTDLFSAGVCGLIAWHAGRFVFAEWEAQTRAFGLVPAWLAQLIIPAGFATIALRFLLSALALQRLEERQP